MFDRSRPFGLGARVAAIGLMGVCIGNLPFSAVMLMFSRMAVFVVALDLLILGLAVTSCFRPQHRILAAAGWLAILRGGAPLVVGAISWRVDPAGFFGEGTAILWVLGTLAVLEILFGWGMLGVWRHRAEARVEPAA